MSEYNPGATLEKDGAIAVLTMDDVKKRNALSEAVVSDMERHIADIMADDSIRAVVLTGANGTFCAGGDISGFDAVSYTHLTLPTTPYV